MRAYDPNLPLFSIHVPKCGGTSLHAILRGWYGTQLYLHYNNPKTNTIPTLHDLKKGVSWKRRLLKRKAYPRGLCVHGHFNHHIGHGIQDYYPEAKQFITILREPFDLAVSNYFYVKALGPESYVNGKSSDIRLAFPNIGDYIERVILKKPSIVFNFMPFDWKPETLESQLQNSFIYIGIVEDMPNTIKQLAKRLGFQMPDIVHKNKSEWDEPIPEGARQEYRARNALAYALYDFARAHYMD